MQIQSAFVFGVLVAATAVACTRDNPDLLPDQGASPFDADVRDATGAGDGFVLDLGPAADAGRDATLPDRGPVLDQGPSPDGALPDLALPDGGMADVGAADMGQGDFAVIDQGAPDQGGGVVDGDRDGVPADLDCDDTDGRIYPGAPERCNGLDDDCDGRPDEAFPELGTACRVGVGRCAADGVLACADMVSTACAGEPGAPQPEACNGEDDDCDSAIDEDVDGCNCEPVDEICNSVDDDCDGFVDEGVLNACGFCGPAPVEQCNGRDDNCDGRIDEGVRNACGACGAVPAEVCDGADNDCDGTVDEGVNNACGNCGPLPAEVCNGDDDDCDGAIDEALAPRACQGVCGAGVQRCVDGRWGGCEGVSPQAEVCNGLDDDCDGVVDDNLERACDSACGAGRQVCAEGAWGACDAPQPAAETCNGRDDDCDGQTDEALRRECASACGAGSETCAAGVWGACDARQPSPEQCNGIDDNCDGQVDEALVQGCRTACGEGRERCEAGGWVGCDAPAPAAEICNRADDDCDGQTDEGVANACGVCGEAPVEICDGVDNDCDGQTDEGLLNACGQCGPVADEQCNAADDDCDGQVDEALNAFCLIQVGRTDAGPRGNELGSALVATGDLDGDGIFDAVAGAPNDTDNDVSRIWAVSGADGRILWEAEEAGAFGTALAYGDVLGAGRPQIVAGVPDAPTPNAGEGGLRFYGPGGGLLQSVGAQEDGDLGASLAMTTLNGGAVAVGEPRRDDGFVNPDVGRVLVVQGQNNALQILWDITGGRGQRLGERLFSAPDFTGDGVTEIIATQRSFADRNTVLLDGSSGASLGTLSPPFGTERTFGEAVVFGRLAANDPVVFAYGAPRASVGDRRTGAVILYSIAGQSLGVVATGGRDDELGGALGIVPQPAQVADTLLAGTRDGGYVQILDRGRDEVALVADGDNTFGSALAVTARLPDGTYRVFIAEPGADRSGGRVWVYSAR